MQEARSWAGESSRAARPFNRQTKAAGFDARGMRRPGLARCAGRSEQVAVYNRDGPNLAAYGSHSYRPETERARLGTQRRAGVRSAGRVLGHLARAYRA